MEISVKHIQEKKSTSEINSENKKTKNSLHNRFFQRVKTQHITQIVRQLATLIQMRLPLDHALSIIQQQLEPGRLQDIISDCKNRVQQGQTLADAFQVYPKHFPEAVIRFVAVGELTGQLGETLDQAATQLEKTAQLKRKLMTALSYPAVIMVVAAGAVTFLLAVVVPTFSEVFSDFGAELPAATQLLVTLGDLIVQRWYVGVIACYATIILIRWLWNQPKIRRRMERTLWRLPLVGKIILKEKLTRFTRTLSALLANGIMLPTAIVTSGRTTGSLCLCESAERMTEQVKRGLSFHLAMKEQGFFPILIIQMIRVGEESGALNTMLNKTAQYYESEIDASIESLNAVLEPIIIVGLSIVIGAILIAMYMQIFNVVNVIQ